MTTMGTAMWVMREVQLQDARASFSAVMEAAAKGEGTVVTKHGRPMAIARAHTLTVATPNLRDFAPMNIDVVDPLTC